MRVQDVERAAASSRLEQQQGLSLSVYFAYCALASLPGVLVGTWVGQQAAARVDTALFKQIVLAMCFGLGVKLALGA